MNGQTSDCLARFGGVDGYLPMLPDIPLAKLKARALQVVEKVWGLEFWIVNNDLYCLKILYIQPGYRCSLHAHIKKDETFVVVDGLVDLETIDHFLPKAFGHYVLSPGRSFRIFPGVAHRFSSKNGATVLEVSTHHDDADVMRIEESGPIPETRLSESEKLQEQLEPITR